MGSEIALQHVDRKCGWKSKDGEKNCWHTWEKQWMPKHAYKSQNDEECKTWNDKMCTIQQMRNVWQAHYWCGVRVRERLWVCGFFVSFFMARFTTIFFLYQLQLPIFFIDSTMSVHIHSWLIIMITWEFRWWFYIVLLIPFRQTGSSQVK